jgi:hypothetical protein
LQLKRAPLATNSFTLSTRFEQTLLSLW